MDSSSRKLYHEDEFDPTLFSNAYYSANSGDLYEETALLPMKILHKVLCSGRIKGDTLIDITVGPSIFLLFMFSDFFKEITVLEFNEFSCKELEKWLATDNEAFDWSHTLKFIMDLKGNSSIDWKEKEENLRRSVKQILICDLRKENPTDPVVLSEADCLFCGCALDAVSKDQDEYCKHLKKISSFVKPGGHLILFGLLNGKFYTVGEHQYHLLTYNEEFLRTALVEAGYVIESLEVTERKAYNSTMSYEHFVVVTALKERDVL